MKKTLLIFAILMFGIESNIAQSNYDFTLSQDDIYQFTVSAVSTFDSGTDVPNLEAFGFTIMLPPGASIDMGSLDFKLLQLGSLTQITDSSLGANDPIETRDAWQVASNTGTAVIPSHPVGEVIDLVTFNVLGNPSSGEIRLLSNTEVPASNVSPVLDAFFNIDVTGGNSAGDQFSELTGDVNFLFFPLSNPDIVTSDFSITPNPTNGRFTINLLDGIVNPSIKIMDIKGRYVKTVKTIFNPQSIAVDASNLASGIYIIDINNTAKRLVIR
ncbi:T9SS type A sorting domain-containing protein [Aquimarina sp. RZ0]|uniref:T9SS type A sorting domain-containing protein n=1 Tax=Aquimarina sp. RZ0 TaxID=2607730 RepID=UPI0011F32925|nr:T9SS type A sorting domain-containing protein [Aquimarina sp. RZ0]KAA1245750.1 T9SS type A sorting domain-containing protein [Aquimarina sp. RZ0]